MSKPTELKRLIAARGHCKAVITKMHIFISGEEARSKDYDSLIVKRDRLIKSFKDYESLNIDIKSLIDEESGPDLENFDEVDDKYCSVLAKLNSLINALHPGTRQSGQGPNQDQQNGKFQRLPRINIKMFSGETSEYMPFINMFTSVVHNNESLSPCDKLYYLTTYLSGEALEVIKHLPLTDDNYAVALNLLKQRFHNKVKIISHHVNAILDLPAIKKPNAACIRALLSQIKQHLSALDNLQQPTEKWDTILVCLLQKKLDFYTVRAFYLEKCSKNEMPSLDDLLSFLEGRAVALETATQKELQPEHKERKHVLSCAATVATSAVNKQKQKSKSVKTQCKFCNSFHQLYTCTSFKLAAVKDRCEFIQKHNICKVCLNEHPTNVSCKFNFKCMVCKKAHNTLLHEDHNEQGPSPQGPNGPQVSLYCKTNKDVLLPTAQVLVECSNGSQIPARALLDTGSQVSLVRSDFIKKINSKIYSDNSTVVGICQGIKNINEKTQLTIKSRLNDFKLHVNCSIVNNITNDLPQFKIEPDILDLTKKLRLADTNFHVSAPIDILLGCDVFFQALKNQPLQLKEQGPYLLETQFGGILAGSVPGYNVTSPGVSLSINFSNPVSNKVHNDPLPTLDKNIKKFWTAETVPEIYSEKTSEQELAENIFKQSVKLENNRFTVALPLKQPISEINLGDSFSAAIQRFYNLERRLLKDNKLYQMYRDFINEYIALGHAEPYDISKYDLDNDAVFFLPHHPVFNENSQTTKMRTVFDGSLKTKNNISLNDVLLNGPIVQNELFDILILFRLPKYILLCDIKQMFRQILVDSPYRALQNILWRESINSPVLCLQLNTVTYGLKSSSYLATRCLKELAERFKERYNLASSVLLSQTYVDDVLTGHDDVETLKEIKRQLIELLGLGGFQLHKWGSNNAMLLDDVPSTQTPVKDVDMSKDNDFIKTLGLRYNVKSDNFYISCSKSNVSNTNTKRQVLSFISKVFDPLGLVGPIVMSAKLLMQNIYNAKIGWDEELPKELNDQWISFANGLIEMSCIQTKRHIDVKGAKQVELVGFADASSKGYGCCLYVRAIFADGTININLLCSKSRANSTNNDLTTPRKELNSALLLSMLTKRVYNTLMTQCDNIHVYLYLDSQIVLAWLNMEPVTLMPYVANRVIKIKNLTKDWSWFYVKTTDNPADCLSRGMEPRALQDYDLWWHGPRFLHEQKYQHCNAGRETPSLVELPEIKKQYQNNEKGHDVCNTIMHPTDELKIFSQYSDVNKIKRIIAYVMRFINNCKTKDVTSRQSGELVPDELENALLTIVRHDQKRHYASEICCLKLNKPIKGPLSSLSPFIDIDGILRVGGRLQNSELSFSQRHPIILAKASHITNLIIWDEHKNLMHAGPKLLLSALNQKFWLINAVRQIKNVIHKCLICFRLKAKAASQLMGSLPSQRVRVSRPFEKVGIDYAGPFNIKFARVRKPVILKAYVLIFVCFVTKAIHVELASDMTTHTFLNCLKRFIARRNKPSQVICDNAATFRCANSNLQELYKLQSSTAHQNTVTKFAANQGITFKFIPAYSPVFGGLWEAGVKSLKYHMKRVIGTSVLTYEEFNTVIIQIEAILNARPLTPMSSDPSDMTYLTPGHFLTGAPITSYPEQDLTNIPTNRLSFWHQCSQLQQNFFKQWHKCYLSMLQNRPKWKNQTFNIKEGMLVLLKNDNVNPFDWPTGRIVRLYPGKDNNVRAFDVKMPNGHVIRTSITKICILPIDE